MHDRFSVRGLSSTLCESQFSPFNNCLVHTMALVILYSVCAIIAITSTVSGEEGGTCKACNCQFNNVKVLNQLIELKIASGKLATIIINYNSIHPGSRHTHTINVQAGYRYQYLTCHKFLMYYCTASSGSYRQVSADNE